MIKSTFDIPEEILEFAWQAPCEKGHWLSEIHLGIAYAILTEQKRCFKIFEKLKKEKIING